MLIVGGEQNWRKPFSESFVIYKSCRVSVQWPAVGVFCWIMEPLVQSQGLVRGWTAQCSGGWQPNHRIHFLHLRRVKRNRALYQVCKRYKNNLESVIQSLSFTIEYSNRFAAICWIIATVLILCVLQIIVSVPGKKRRNGWAHWPTLSQTSGKRNNRSRPIRWSQRR